GALGAGKNGGLAAAGSGRRTAGKSLGGRAPRLCPGLAISGGGARRARRLRRTGALPQRSGISAGQRRAAGGADEWRAAPSGSGALRAAFLFFLIQGQFLQAVTQ